MVILGYFMKDIGYRGPISMDLNYLLQNIERKELKISS